ncbi:MAG: GNAT family N-acetyltransferase [Trueperaceae bacterium]|nr:GNAT family N-acetyltransferase [Trueperaceae bacterium]
MVQLLPLSAEEFDSYLEQAIKDYAEDKIAAGNWQVSEALENSRRDYLRLLPEGVRTANNYLFSIRRDAGEKVGVIWFALNPEGLKSNAFIYDFLIDEPYRRKGYGKAALLAAEEKAKALGISTLSLHVFGHNQAARKLYEQLGYEITNINMAKKLT